MTIDHARSVLKVFVGGPIQHALDGTHFDERVKQIILFIIDRLREANCLISSAHLLERFGLDTADLNPDEVARRDFRLMQECDFFVAVLVPADGEGILRTDGTHVELGWASAMQKPVIIVTMQQCMPHLSHLVRGLNQITGVRFLDLERIYGEPQELLATVDELYAQHFGARTYQLI